ncbi:unnamed protein product [Cyprideis torosa]|uniref:Uncharacterized protein n=1 Tax=Cyprideis torosa TaxID=163714 RepID=A0A7R8ZKP3_9CRUS|nr:unnamed protein product [Cyprideis torosa]CAG0891520.1 unnamed protein product [Cyprideis torosa]
MRALVASSNQSLQRLCTLSQIDAELAAIQLMDSKQDFKPWLLNKVNFLLNNDMQKELRALCDDLLGPAHSSATTSKWEDQIMGHSKRELLREILPLFAKCLPVQRLCLEYKEQLDVLDRFAHSNNASR